MNELIEHGMYTPMSLSQLNLTSSSSSTTRNSTSSNNQGVDLDRLGVASVYDRKKFAQLKQFVRNVVATVQRSRSSASTKQPVDQQISNSNGGTQTGASVSRAVSSSSTNHPDEMIMKSLMNARAGTNASNNPMTNGLAATDRKPQLFKKNPNLANTGIVTARNTGVAKKIVKATASNPSAHTNGAHQPTTINSRASTGITTISQQKAQLLRAKSSEPLDIKKKLFSIAPSKSTVSIGMFFYFL